MATSGSTDFSETTLTIITDAMTWIGVLEPGEVPEHEPFQYALRQLNRMLKAWEGMGYNLWRATEGEILLVAGQQSYTMGGPGTPDFPVRPMRISDARFRQADGTDAPRMIAMSRQDYFTLPNKDAGGTSTQFYYDPQRNSGTLFVWPVLQTVSTESIRFTFQRSFEDFDGNENEPDVPQEWFDAIVKNLGATLAETFYPGNPQLQQGYLASANAAADFAANFDREYADVNFMLGEKR